MCTCVRSILKEYIKLYLKIRSIRKTRCMLWYLLHLDLFYSSAFRFILFYLIRKQMRLQCRCPPPSAFASTAELANTSIEVKIQCLKYSFYWLLKQQKHRACEGLSKQFPDPMNSVKPLVLHEDLPLACEFTYW